MYAKDWKTAAPDAVSTAAVAANGLEYRVVDATDAAVFDPYLQAETRGFLGGEQSTEQLAGARDALAFRRFVGVYDPAAPDLTQPVGTVNSWVTEVGMPGGSMPMWAISGVTVAPTHRRKGIARAMLEGELRTAADAGLALAGLTVTEATIYGRYGFSPATFNTDWRIETKRAGWVGPRPDGRLDFIDRESAGHQLAELHARVRSSRPGEIEPWPDAWRRMVGLGPGREGGGKIRVVRWADSQGVSRGIAVYRLSDETNDYTKHELELLYLLSENVDAYAALWRFVLEHDLVTVVKASLRAIDEPLRWMIADQRAATVQTYEHEWLRVLDVAAVLSSRTYAAPGIFVLSVTDPLGFADGAWRLTIDAEGAAVVEPLDEQMDAAADVTLSVGALSSLVLGGVSAATLRAAGHVRAEAKVALALDASLTSPTAPYLSVWY